MVMMLLRMVTSRDSPVHGRQEETSGKRRFPQQVAGVLTTPIIITIISIIGIIISINIIMDEIITMQLTNKF